jgi:hypothetical protein
MSRLRCSLGRDGEFLVMVLYPSLKSAHRVLVYQRVICPGQKGRGREQKAPVRERVG